MFEPRPRTSILPSNLHLPPSTPPHTSYENEGFYSPGPSREGTFGSSREDLQISASPSVKGNSFLPSYLFPMTNTPTQQISSPSQYEDFRVKDIATLKWNNPSLLSSPIDHGTRRLVTSETGKKTTPEIEREIPPFESIYDAETLVADMEPEPQEITSMNVSPVQQLSLNGITPLSPSQRTHGIRSAVSPFPKALNTKESRSEPLVDERWITVFGFPVGSTQNVLKHFAKYGDILQHRTHVEGNWLHIQYQTRLQAQRALAKNGLILDSLMIGVVPYKEQQATKIVQNQPFKFRPSSSGTYAVESVIPQTAPAPQSSLWSKFSEYILGV